MRSRTTLKKSVAAVAATLLLGAAAIVTGQGPQGRPGGAPPGAQGTPGGPGAMPPGLMQINLTEQQRAALRTLVEQDRESRKASMDELRTLRQELTIIVFRSGVDSRELAKLTGRVGDLQRQALEAEVALQVKIAALLTEEQRHQIVSARAPRPR